MAKRKRNRLTDLACRQAKDGTHADGGGLALKVAKDGTHRSWILRYTKDGKRVMRGLGSYPAVSLAHARQAAADTIDGDNKPAIVNLRMTAMAGYPKPKSRAASAPTFRECAQSVIALRAPNWSSLRHATQWTESLTNHVYPAIGDKSVSEITSGDILALLTPIWNDKAETATRVKQRIGVVLDWAIAAGYRSDNPATAVGKALPRRPRLKQHHAALPYADVPAAMDKVRQSTADPVTRLAFELMVLCANRTGEIRGGTWAEIDLENRLWEIPAERMKMRRSHVIPLSDRAIEILADAQELSDGDGLIFPNKRTGDELSNHVFQSLVKRLDIPCVPHGFRSSFKDWAMETGFDWTLSEVALAHRLGDTVAQAYARTNLIERRREMMQDWADYIRGNTQGN